jgi:hypothetical protein
LIGGFWVLKHVLVTMHLSTHLSTPLDSKAGQLDGGMLLHLLLLPICNGCLSLHACLAGKTGINRLHGICPHAVWLKMSRKMLSYNC